MLGILKAGGAFVPLDPEWSRSKREEIMSDAQCRHMIVSPFTTNATRRLSEHTIMLTAVSLEMFSQHEKSVLPPKPSPSDTACVLFSSDSGWRGVVIEHGAFCSGAMEGQKHLFDAFTDPRIPQLSNCTSHISLTEIFSTLCHGGTVCIPGEKEQMAPLVSSAAVNLAVLRPALAQTVHPDQLPSLKQLVLVVSSSPDEIRDAIAAWQGRVKLIAAYGQAETCGLTTFHGYDSSAESLGMIGRGSNASCWVVDPQDHNKLAPIGCKGELLIQSHNLARRYLNNAKLTQEVFLEKVDWLPVRSRLYKTGDLVKCHANGNLEFLSRGHPRFKIGAERTNVKPAASMLNFGNKHAINEIERTTVTENVSSPHVRVPQVQKQHSERETLKDLQPVPARPCVHDVISAQTRLHPTAPAIFSSDISLSYLQLDRLSSHVAAHLRSLGIGAESRVPICFEKSPWAVVAMLAVLKAGGSFIPLDPEHPYARHQELVDQLGGVKIIISSLVTSKVCRKLGARVIKLANSWLPMIDVPVDLSILIKPSNVAYILFTSGSTGKPKGVVMEHAALWSSCALGHGHRLQLDTTSRVLQFSNYTFDVSLSEIFSTLFHGGTICVPSESERLHGIVEFINNARVNTAMLTPSFAKTLTPKQVPHLKKLVVGGEPPTKETVQTWFGHVELINGYGPAEACIYSTTHQYQSADESPTIIGTAGGANLKCWVVDPRNHNKIAPVGTVGELMVQGPGIARGYLNDDELTKKSFVDRVDWLPELASMNSYPFKFYKTGDLVRYSPCGNIEYVRRKDSQVKIRGQRLDPGEVEYKITQLEPRIEHAVVQVINVESHNAVAAFISVYDDQLLASHAEKNTFAPLTGRLKDIVVRTAQELRSSLPRYMVPTLFFPIRFMPFVSAMKLDRRRLLRMVSSLTAKDAILFSTAGEKRLSQGRRWSSRCVKFGPQYSTCP